MVFSVFVICWRLPSHPTRRSPVLLMATTEGRSLSPSAVGMITGSPPCIADTRLKVVPRSIPTVLPISILLDLRKYRFVSLYLHRPCQRPRRLGGLPDRAGCIPSGPH